MLKAFSLSAILCAFVLAGGIAQAAAGFSGPGAKNGAPGWGQQLTPEQRQQAERIFEENFSNMDATRQALAAKRQELDEELRSDNPNPGKIESLSREIGELRGKMLAARVNVRSQLAQEGLPQDFYGPGAPRSGKGPQRGSEVWQGDRRGHHGHGHGSRRGWGCPGGCWNY